ncbi:MAG: Mrp/NBP35 family ATP-binding protein [Bacteroidia bacterium]|nr:Mrp/NBP35 family ATP-binding protein [Bacteroidia bacterium]
MSYTEEDILKALMQVEDPDLHKDIVTLGMVRNLKLTETMVSFSVFLTTPACPMKEVIENACRTAIHHFVKMDLEIKIEMTSDVTSRKGDKSILPGVRNIIAVASGKGGVGKSTVSANLAAYLAGTGATVGLLDADIYGPSIPTMFGISGPVEMIESVGRKLMLPVEKNGIKLFSIGLLSRPDEAIVWRGPMVSSAIKQFVNDVHWGELDYLIIDMPPGTGDVQITISQMIPLNGVVIITTPQDVAIADARKAMAMFRMPAINVKILGVIENMSYFSPPDQPNLKYKIFGEGGAEKLCTEFNTDLLGSLPINAELCEASDNGSTTSGSYVNNLFSEITANLARKVSISNSLVI